MFASCVVTGRGPKNKKQNGTQAIHTNNIYREIIDVFNIEIIDIFDI